MRTYADMFGWDRSAVLTAMFSAFASHGTE
jgi:hypothetical protein